MNTLAVTFAIVIVGVVAFSAAISTYYYDGMQASLEAKAKTASSFFTNYIRRTYAEYYQSAYQYTEQFAERDKLELQFIGTNGKIETSTIGITAGTKPATQDIDKAIETHALSIWRGRNPSTNERVLSITNPILSADGQLIGMMRYVSSLSEVDKVVMINIAVASGIGILIISAVILAMMSFVRSVVGPINEVTQMTRAIADGSFGAKIENKYSDEIGEMVKSINEMSMKISQSDKLKTEFISSVSHELRTPLTAIAGWSETLLYEENITSDMKRGLNIILKESKRLGSMVEELLDITHVESGRFTVRIEQMDLEALLNDVVVSYAEVLKRADLTLEYIPASEELPEIPGDPLRLKQVFLNLLDNAAKYGASGKKVIMASTLVYDESGKPYVQVTVRDFGIGIPEDELELVKRKFYKGSSKERGNGIGLSVCDEIIKRHNGHLTLANAPDKGIIVTVLLPRS